MFTMGFTLLKLGVVGVLGSTGRLAAFGPALANWVRNSGIGRFVDEVVGCWSRAEEVLRSCWEDVGEAAVRGRLRTGGVVGGSDRGVVSLERREFGDTAEGGGGGDVWASRLGRSIICLLFTSFLSLILVFFVGGVFVGLAVSALGMGANGNSGRSALALSIVARLALVMKKALEIPKSGLLNRGWACCCLGFASFPVGARLGLGPRELPEEVGESEPKLPVEPAEEPG